MACSTHCSVKLLRADEIGIANYVVFARPRPHCVHRENSKNPPKLVVNGWVPIWRTHITYDIYTSCHIPPRPPSFFCTTLHCKCMFLINLLASNNIIYYCCIVHLTYIHIPLTPHVQFYFFSIWPSRA